MFLLLALACSDQTLHASGDSKPGDGEECDGSDNDGDGEADEGFGDVDGDGTADCIDESCELASANPTLTETRVCAPPSAVTDPFNLEVAWAWGISSDCNQVVAGRLDGEAEASVVCSGAHGDRPSSLTVLSGASGEELFEVPHSDGFDDPPVTLADVDQDGRLDIVTMDIDAADTPYVVALGGDGAALWQSTADVGFLVLSYAGLSSDLAAADLDGDGDIEVATHSAILNGRDGSVLQSLPVDEPHDRTPTDYTVFVGELAIADIDLDGRPELLDGWRLVNTGGYEVWNASTFAPNTDQPIGAPLVVQADSDPGGEVVIAGLSSFYVVDTDGSLLAILPREGDDQGIPAALDLDHDGLTDLVYPGLQAVRAVRLDGSVVWSTATDDAYGSDAEATTADLDGDGEPEVLVDSLYATLVLRASDGAELWRSPTRPEARAGRTIAVDLDGDGSAELVSAHSVRGEIGPALTVYRHVAGGNLAAAPPFWPNTTWSGSGLLPDGSPQPQPPAAWLEWGIFRGQPAGYEWGSELHVEVLDDCVASCADDGLVRVSYRLDNLGPQRAPPGVEVDVYALAGDGTRSLLESHVTDTTIAAPEASPAWTVETTTAQAQRGLVFVVLDEGGIARHDCDPTNDEVTWSLGACP